MSSSLLKGISKSLLDALQPDMDRFLNEVGSADMQNSIRNVRIMVQLTFDRYREERLKAAPSENVSEISGPEVITNEPATNNAVSSIGIQTEPMEASDDTARHGKSDGESISLATNSNSSIKPSPPANHDTTTEEKSKSCDGFQEQPPVSSTPSREAHNLQSRMMTRSRAAKRARSIDNSENTENPRKLRSRRTTTDGRVHGRKKIPRENCSEEVLRTSPTHMESKNGKNHCSTSEPQSNECVPVSNQNGSNIPGTSAAAPAVNSNAASELPTNGPTNEIIPSIGVVSKEQKEEFVCSWCKKVFADKTKFIAHLRMHFEDEKLSDEEMIKKYRKYT
ncbi:uncharacterized protein LOC129565610 [Sitodiplosis mosellana]|uniref:uncharacterized protein LOC129565610 n=1 Tax=Sitodiplosis mosellana TaxID=263140 RepID=UPI0024442BA3|nr:uncharacterized protein LOC129565610 [Sitodiplosis mosellana]